MWNCRWQNSPQYNTNRRLRELYALQFHYLAEDTTPRLRLTTRYCVYIIGGQNTEVSGLHYYELE